MTRRLTLAMVGIVVATLVVAGLGTLALARAGARQHTEDALRQDAAQISAAIGDADDTVTPRLLIGLRQALDLEGVAVLRFGPGGRTADPLPAGVEADDLDFAALRQGRVLSGNHGSLVWAASAQSIGGPGTLPARSLLAVAVLTRNADPSLLPALRWFLLAGVATVAIGAVVAVSLGRRVTRPLRQAEEATRRISTGDLSARTPEPPPGTDPELRSLMASINTMAEVLERSKGVERQFLLSVSHDLRTPLTSIQGYAEALNDGALADPRLAGTVILGEAKRLDRLVRDLLDLAKLDARNFSFEPAVVDLADVAMGTADGFRPEADEAGITLTLEVPPVPVLVVADPDRLAQIGANLVENALKFTRTGIRLRVSGVDGSARLDIVDDGPGIAADDLPHVFERLYVSRHQPRRQEAGSGLGLAIVRELVVAMGGRVEATAAPGGGACLSVLLPHDGQAD